MSYMWKTICEICEGTPEPGDHFTRVSHYVTGKTGWDKLGTNIYFCEVCWKDLVVSRDLDV